MRPDLSTIFFSSMASAWSSVAGLSDRTWKPASRAAFAAGKWTWLGVTMATKSILSPSGSWASFSTISVNDA